MESLLLGYYHLQAIQRIRVYLLLIIPFSGIDAELTLDWQSLEAEEEVYLLSELNHRLFEKNAVLVSLMVTNQEV